LQVLQSSDCQALNEEAERDLLDIPRLRKWLADVQGGITFKSLPHASPLSIPAMMQLGKETLVGDAKIAMLERASHGNIADMRLETVREFVKEQEING